MGALKVLRIVTQIVATIILLGAIAVSVAAIVTPAWQTVHVAELNQVHQHGLWMDCVGVEHIARRTIQGGNSKWTCTYKFNRPADDNHDGHSHGVGHQGGEVQHKYLPWHKAVLALMCVATAFGIIALLFSFCAPCVKVCGIIWSVCCVVSTGCSAAGVIVFFLKSHELDYRFLHGVGNTYEQLRGYSFWCGAAGVVAFLIAAILAILTTVLFFVISHQKKQKTVPTHVAYSWPKNQTSV